MGLLEYRGRPRPIAGIVQRHRVNVGKPGRLRPARRRAAQQIHRLGPPTLAHAQEPERVQRLGIVGGDLERLLEEALRVGLAALGPKQVGEVQEGGNEPRVQEPRIPQLGLGVGRAPKPRVEIGQVHVRLRPVGVDHHGCHELGETPIEIGLLLGRERLAGDVREGVRGRQAHGPDRIAKAGRAQTRALRAGTLSSAAIAVARTSGSASAIAARTAGIEASLRYSGKSASADARAMAGWLWSVASAARSVGHSEAAPPGVERAGEVRSACRTRGSVPAHHLLGCPLRAAIAVASRAGIGGAQGDGQVGPGHAEAVISPGVDHHVRPRRHVAGDATSGLRARLVMVVLRTVEPGGEMALAQTALPGARSPSPCGSWQSEHVTPALNIRLCRNDPYS